MHFKKVTTNQQGSKALDKEKLKVAQSFCLQLWLSLKFVLVRISS